MAAEFKQWLRSRKQWLRNLNNGCEVENNGCRFEQWLHGCDVDRSTQRTTTSITQISNECFDAFAPLQKFPTNLRQLSKKLSKSLVNY